MSSPIFLLVDSREAYVQQCLEATKKPSDISVISMQLTTGDFAVIYNGALRIIIERKTWTDLAASICDGRTRNNQKLIDARQNTGCHIVYIVEGSFPNLHGNASRSRVPTRALVSHLDHIALRDGFTIIYTRDAQYTTDRLILLAQSLRTLDKPELPNTTTIVPTVSTTVPVSSALTTSVASAPSASISSAPMSAGATFAASVTSTTPSAIAERTTPTVTISTAGALNNDTHIPPMASSADASSSPSEPVSEDILQLLRTPHTKTDFDVIVDIWCKVPKVQRITAISIAKRWSLADLLTGNIPIDALSEIHYPGGRALGRARAASIIASGRNTGSDEARNKQYPRAASKSATKAPPSARDTESMLAAIPSVSTDAATSILTAYTLVDIACGRVTTEQIARITRDTGTHRPIGTALAEKIVRIMTYTPQPA